MEGLYKGDLNNLDNQDGVITHLEPDTWNVSQWAFTTNKASGGDGIPAEFFQILKDDAMKVLRLQLQMETEESSEDKSLPCRRPVAWLCLKGSAGGALRPGPS